MFGIVLFTRHWLLSFSHDCDTSIMPPRQSSRAASVKPSSAAALPKPAARPLSQPAKRPALTAVEQNDPPAKRTKSSAREVPAARNSRARSSTPTAAKKQVLTSKAKRLPAVKEEISQIPYFNPLPGPCPHVRPANQLFVWGVGDFGQFGLGVDGVAEFKKPRKSTWFSERMEDGTFGGVGAGLEAISAGGLCSLFIDEKGTVSQTICFSLSRRLTSARRFGLVAIMMMLLSVVVQLRYRTQKLLELSWMKRTSPPFRIQSKLFVMRISEQLESRPVIVYVSP